MAYKDYGYTGTEADHLVNYLEQPLIGLLNKDKNRCILDAGCGNGYLVKSLIRKEFNAYGTDASEMGIRIAQQEYPERFAVQDLMSESLPAPLQGLPLDTIIATEVIEHLYDPDTFIAFCKNQLQPGGQLILSTPYHGYLKNLVLSIFNQWDAHMDPLWQGGHIKLWSASTLSRLLVHHGFRVLAFKGCGRIPYLWKSMIIKAELI